ncbi:14514_t:CDS:2 [Dentiscutata erythropus]|uniref:14514_t:CDS:1 n=1 Tax=Dentiscutata erythropus TaxID=1348616 RepID=A0A9N9IZC8_9GLOM|nr:14514_t:CDS:2 [Dentiscutata erythropus]
MLINGPESAQNGLNPNETQFPLIFDPTRKVLIPQYVHPEKYLPPIVNSTERNRSFSVLSDEDTADEQNAPSPTETSRLSVFSDKDEQGESSTTQPNKIWTDKEIMILLDYVEANYEQWKVCKSEFYRFIEKANVFEKKFTRKQIGKKINTLVAIYSKLRKCKEIGIKYVGPNRLCSYDRMHEIFGHRPIEEYIRLRNTSEPKKRTFQNIDSIDDDEQTNSSKVKAKRAKYSRERNTSDDDRVSDSEFETPILRSKSKKQSDLCFKLTRTQDGIPTYSFGPRVQQYWSCDMIHLLMDCIEENIDVFWKNPTMFWDWLATNVFTNRSPPAIAQKFYELRPDKHSKGLRALKKLKNKSENTKLIEKIDRCFQRLYEKKTWSRDRDANVVFKYPPGYNPEQIFSENDIIRPLPTASLKINEPDLNFAKHLLKYSVDNDCALSKCLGTNEKIRWPELIEDIAPEPQKCEPVDWVDREANVDPELTRILFKGHKTMTTISAMANASVTLFPDDSKREFKLFNKDLNNKNSLMAQEVGFITDIVNSFNEQKEPSIPEQIKVDDYTSNILKCCTTFAAEDTLKKILDAVGSLHWTVIQENKCRQEMSTSDSEQHLFDPSEYLEVTTDRINSEDYDFTTEHINSEDYNEPTIKWDTILRAAKIAGLPQSVIKNTYYRISEFFDKDKQFEDSIKEMGIGELEGLNNIPYLDRHTQLRIWDTEVE